MRIEKTLTKDYILSKVSEEDIFEKFIGDTVQLGEKYVTGLRTDPNPSAVFYYNQHGKLKLKDFGSNFNGDCFDYVARLHGQDCNNARGFNITLEIVAKSFNIYQSDSVYRIGKPKKYIDKRQRVPDFRYSTCNFTALDLRYWRSLNVSPEILNRNRIKRVSSLYNGDTVLYNFTLANPCYVYLIGIRNGLVVVQFYFPFKDKGSRFLTNISTPRGLDLLEPAPFGIITKSYKDQTSLNSFGIQACSIPSETTYLSKHQFDFIKRLYPVVFTLFDNDLTGKKASIYHRNNFGTIPLLFPADSGIKDWTEFVLKKGVDATHKLIHDNIHMIMDFVYDEQRTINHFLNPYSRYYG